MHVADLNQLLIFKVLDAEQDVNVFPVLCQRDVWGCTHPTSTEITWESRSEGWRTAGGFSEVEAAFAASVTAGSRDGDGTLEQDKQSENLDVEKEIDSDG